MRILITGGRSDIGEAMIRRREKMGDEILTTASSEPTLEDMQERYKDLSRVKCYQWELSQPTMGAAPIDAFIAKGIDGLILNAAPPTKSMGRLHELSDADILAALQTQIYGNVWLTKRCLPKMVEQGFGRILLISSLTVYGTSRYSLYSMSKSALEGVIKVVATDYGEFNIRANIIRPGVIATERNKRFWSRSSYTSFMTELIPAKALGTPEQVAEVTDPFMSEKCYMNGADVDVSGGLPNFRSDYLLKVKN